MGLTRLQPLSQSFWVGEVVERVRDERREKRVEEEVKCLKSSDVEGGRRN